MIDDRLIVALDVPDVQQAMHLVLKLKDIVRTFKIGHWLMNAPDLNDLLVMLRDNDKDVFWDAKIYDIGETVTHGVMRAAYRGMKYITVHGDPEILRAATMPFAKHMFPKLQVLAVTVLSSMNQSSLKSMGYACSLDDLIVHRFINAVQAGAHGVIMAPKDLHLLSEVNIPVGFHIITPGIRMEIHSHNEHRRAGTPSDAISNGATQIVVGRPIIHSDDPLGATMKIIEDMASVTGPK